MKSTEEINKAFDNIPKYCRVTVGKNEYRYYPIIMKYEWNGHDYAYIAMYAKFTKYINPNNFLFRVQATDYNIVIEKFITEVEKLKLEGKIVGKSWKGSAPKFNPSVDIKL